METTMSPVAADGCPWATLPDELCTHIFSLLDVPDLCAATSVCKSTKSGRPNRVIMRQQQWSNLAWAEQKELNLSWPFYKRVGDEVLFSLLKKVPKAVQVSIKSMVASRAPVTDAAIEELVLRCPKVEHLALINCTALTPAAVQTIANGYGDQLISLSVEGCVAAIANAHVKRHFTPMTLLQHLSLEGCWKITNDGIRTLAQTCRGLRTIKLSGCYKLSDDALKYLADNCQSMEKWRLARLPAISDKGLKYIAGARGTSLRTLDVSACPIGNDGVAAILAGCSNIEELSVKHCKRLGNAPFLEHIVNCPNLLTLDTQRLNLDNEAIKAIISACPNLRVANFKCANHLDPSLLATIPLHCPDLEVLRLYGDSVNKDLFANISTTCKRLHTLDLRRLNLPFDEVKVIGDSSSACKRSLRRLCIVEAVLTAEHIAWFQAQFPLAIVLWQKKKRG